MIVDQKITDMISHELDRLMQQNHKPYYKMARIDIYSGRLLNPNELDEQKKKSPSVRKMFVPDQLTRDVCTRINKILLYGRPPHPSSHGFERQRDLSTFIEPHRSKRRLLTIHLIDAFERIGKRRIQAIGKDLLGLDEEHARYFGILLTMRGRMAGGNPLSPQILNIQAYKTDRYLTEFSEKYRLTYTRFLDAFAFSSNVFIHTEIIAKIKRIISRCNWMIDNERVDIQSGNHFHIVGQVVVPDHVLKKQAQKASSDIYMEQKSPNPFKKQSLESLLKTVDPTSRLPREHSLIQSLKKQIHRGNSSDEN